MTRRAALLAAVAGFALSWAALSCSAALDATGAPPAQVKRDTVLVPYPVQFSSSSLATTFCTNGNPKYWIDGWVVDNGSQALFDEVVAHERAHVAQIERAGGCDVWAKTATQSEIRYAEELEAYCAGVKAYAAKTHEGLSYRAANALAQLNRIGAGVRTPEQITEDWRSCST